MDVSDLDINKAGYFVSRERKEKADKYFYEKDKRLSLGVELLLKHALKKIGIVNPIFSTDEYDKPYLDDHHQVHFNLSHSEDYVACTVSDSPVGVDIEYVDEVDLDIGKHFFYGTEYEYILNNKTPINAFFQLWVLKESYMKMTGLGFRLPLDGFRVEIADKIRLAQDDEVKFGLWNVCKGDYMMGLCSQNKMNKPELVRLSDLELD